MQRVWSTYLDTSGGGQLQKHHPSADNPHMMDANSPRSSTTSHANSSFSATPSTRHILNPDPPMTHDYPSVSDYGGLLQPPLAPFASSSSSSASYRSTDNLNPNTTSNNNSNLSLSVNYIPSKFSSSLISSSSGSNPRNRKKSGFPFPRLAKSGGGLDAFRADEDRMQGGKGKKLRWNKFKWILICTNTLLTTYSLAALVAALLTWFDVFTHASILRTGNRPELILSTIAAALGILTALTGWAGILLNNRGFLAWYTFLTWLTFAAILVPGYITYKKRTFNLEGKINAQWSRSLGAAGRGVVQDQLSCCGYFSPFVEATLTQTCYARALLPGCKLPYMTFERNVLKRWYGAAFALVPVQIAVMVAGLLCSDHVTWRFGKGMMPEAYRLDLGTMAVIMENYANQLAEEYGADIAQDILKSAKSKVLPASLMPDNAHSNTSDTKRTTTNSNESTTSLSAHSFTHLGDLGLGLGSSAGGGGHDHGRGRGRGRGRVEDDEEDEGLGLGLGLGRNDGNNTDDTQIYNTQIYNSTPIHAQMSTQRSTSTGKNYNYNALAARSGTNFGGGGAGVGRPPYPGAV